MSRQIPRLKGDWGILGGTFDPIQLGHLRLASDMRTAKNLDGVLFVPAFQPVHKVNRCRAAFEDRLAMVHLAVEGEKSFVVSAVEAEMGLPGYSLNTVRALKRDHPDATFFFIVGADLPHEFETWHKPDELMQEVRFLVGARSVNEPSHNAGTHMTDRVEYVATTRIDVSSTLVREKIAQGISRSGLSKLVGDRVAEYIVSKELYK